MAFCKQSRRTVSGWDGPTTRAGFVPFRTCRVIRRGLGKVRHPDFPLVTTPSRHPPYTARSCKLDALVYFRLNQLSGLLLGAISMITMPAWADSGADAEAPAAEETSMLRFQSTYIWQKKNSFNAAYSGPNSLSSQAERSYTLTFDAYLGFKPWQGGELYFVPEITQGLALSSLTGLGGFTNGEATRVSGTNPTLYRQKLFLRQTWNQGGGQDKVDAAVDQMAGTVDRNRWVLTAGNFSTLDVFDDNAYAKDPRTQFMNWSGMSHTSFDYAADARGFGWGAALEWYQGPWVLRAGRMTGPIRCRTGLWAGQPWCHRQTMDRGRARAGADQIRPGPEYRTGHQHRVRCVHAGHEGRRQDGDLCLCRGGCLVLDRLLQLGQGLGPGAGHGGLHVCAEHAVGRPACLPGGRGYLVLHRRWGLALQA